MVRQGHQSAAVGSLPKSQREYWHLPPDAIPRAPTFAVLSLVRGTMGIPINVREWTRNVKDLGRYSIEKLHVFYKFHTKMSPREVLQEILLAPFPLLLVILALEVVPLGDPHTGIRLNALTIVRSAVSHAILIAAMLVAVKRSLVIPDAQYSLPLVGGIAAVGGITLELLWLPVAFLWRFPVPYREFVGIIPFTILIVGLNFLLARDTITAYATKLKILLPLFGAQLLLFYAFLGLSILFARAPIGVQIVMIASLQLAKVITKNLLWRLARRIDDVSTDVTICIVEMSGALYQTVCLQYANRIELEIVIMALDFLQAMYEVHTQMGHVYHTDNRRTLQTAVTIVSSAFHPGNPERRGGSCRRPSTFSSVNETARGSRLLPALLTTSSRQTSQQSIKTEQEHDSAVPVSLRAFGEHVAAGSVALADFSSCEHPDNVIAVAHSSDPQGILLQSARSEPPYTVQPKSPLDVPRRASWSPHLPGSSRRLRVYAGIAVGVATTELDPEKSIAIKSPEHFEPPDLRRGNRVQPNRRHRQPALTHSRHASLAARATNRLLQSSRALTYAVTSEPLSTTPQQKCSSVSPTPSGHVEGDSLSASPNEELPATASSDALGRKPAASFSQPLVIDGLVIARRDQAHILQQSLQLLFACEVLVFAEFMEILVPVVYGTYVGVAWHLPNARYSLVLRSMTRANMYTTVITSFISAGLELISFIWLSWLMRRRYGISPLRQLAFVLKQYRGAFHGKLIACFITIVLSATVHQGVEFLF